MTTTYTLQGKFRDHARNPIPGTRLTATVSTNLGSLALNDLGDNAVDLPRATRLSVAADGTFSVTLTATNATGISVLDGTLRYIVNVAYSDEHGNDLHWDSGYFELTGNTDLSTVAGTDAVIDVSTATVMVSTLVQQAVQNHTPGIDLGTVARTTAVTSTATTVTAATAISGLSVSITGQGRPVDLRFFAPIVYNSGGANVAVSAMILRNGDPVSTDNQLGSVYSPATNLGPALTIVRRTAPIAVGAAVTFTVRLWTPSGTANILPSATYPIELSVTSR